MNRRMVCWFFVLLLFRPVGLYAQSHEVQQLLLNVEKLAQLKDILNNMYKGYKTLRAGYTAIKDISEGNFSIHKIFLDNLLEVSPVVKNYKRVADIIRAQLRIVQECKTAQYRLRASGSFTSAEINYTGRVYKKLLDGSIQRLEELLMILTNNQVRMTDDERLSAIDNIYARITDQLSFLRQFNNSNALLGLQRAGEQAEIDRMRKIHGIK